MILPTLLKGAYSKMPFKRCNENGKSGWKWGDRGKCYTYTAGNEESENQAKLKAAKQAVAIGEDPSE